MSKPVNYSKVANADWDVWQNDDGLYSDDSVTRAILLDIRRELRTLNQLLHCPNFVGIPATLRGIAKNTEPRERAKKVKR